MVGSGPGWLYLNQGEGNQGTEPTGTLSPNCQPDLQPPLGSPLSLTLSDEVQSTEPVVPPSAFLQGTQNGGQVIYKT